MTHRRGAMPADVLLALSTISFAGTAGGAFLLATTPALVVHSGGSTTLAGMTAGIFMVSAVVLQLATARLLRFAGYHVVASAAVLLLSLPCLIGLTGVEPEWWLVISTVRGGGFGILMVLNTALPALLASPSLVGRTLGVQGAIVGVCNGVALPGGIFTLHTAGPHAVVVIGAVLPLVGLVGVPILKGQKIGRVGGSGLAVPGAGRGLLLRACVMLAAASAAYGAVTTLVPIGSMSHAEVLLVVVAGALAAGRYAGGRWAERLGESSLLRSMLVGGAVGVLLIGVAAASSCFPAAVAGAALYGFAFGVVQTQSILVALTACGRELPTTASVWWNLSTDAATGLGSIVFASAAAASTFFVAYSSSALCMAACAAMSISASRTGRPPPSPHQ